MDKVKLTINVRKGGKNNAYEAVAFVGDLDKFGLQTVRDQLELLVNELESKYLVFDFSKLNFLNSESIGFLLTLHYRLVKKEKALVIVSAPSNVKDVLDVIGMLKIINYYESFSSFEESLNNL